MLEDFLVRRRLGGLWNEDLTARQVEAFVLLEREIGKGQTRSRGGDMRPRER